MKIEELISFLKAAAKSRRICDVNLNGLEIKDFFGKSELMGYIQDSLDKNFEDLKVNKHGIYWRSIKKNCRTQLLILFDWVVSDNGLYMLETQSLLPLDLDAEELSIYTQSNFEYDTYEPNELAVNHHWDSDEFDPFTGNAVSKGKVDYRTHKDLLDICVKQAVTLSYKTIGDLKDEITDASNKFDQTNKEAFLNSVDESLEDIMRKVSNIKRAGMDFVWVDEDKNLQSEPIMKILLLDSSVAIASRIPRDLKLVNLEFYVLQNYEVYDYQSCMKGTPFLLTEKEANAEEIDEALSMTPSSLKLAKLI